MRPVYLVLMLVLLTSLSGCLSGEDSSDEMPSSYVVESTLTYVEVEAKSAYYQDGVAASWSVESGPSADAIEAAGGNVVGVLFISIVWASIERYYSKFFEHSFYGLKPRDLVKRLDIFGGFFKLVGFVDGDAGGRDFPGACCGRSNWFVF